MADGIKRQLSRLPFLLNRMLGQILSSPAIRYAKVWEDADCLCSALSRHTPGHRFLSIASAGDNTLALLTLDPSEIVAVDCDPRQLACLSLKIAAFRELEEPELLAFLGVTQTFAPLDLYARLRPSLSQSTKQFWDARTHSFRHGLLFAGRLERYLAIFRHLLLPLVHSTDTIQAFLNFDSIADQERFYQQHWDTRTWRLMCNAFFNRLVMSLLARDADQFKYVGRCSIVPHLLAGVRRVIHNTPTSQNPYLHYALTGRYSLNVRPLYLRSANIPVIRSRLSRITPVCTRVENLVDSLGFDGMNLSNIFEYMSPDTHKACYYRLLLQSRSKTRLVYWNLFAPRTAPGEFRSRLQPTTDDESLAVHKFDRLPSYRSFHIDEVV